LRSAAFSNRGYIREIPSCRELRAHEVVAGSEIRLEAGRWVDDILDPLLPCSVKSTPGISLMISTASGSRFMRKNERRAKFRQSRVDGFRVLGIGINQNLEFDAMGVERRTRVL